MASNAEASKPWMLIISLSDLRGLPRLREDCGLWVDILVLTGGEAPSLAGEQGLSKVESTDFLHSRGDVDLIQRDRTSLALVDGIGGNRVSSTFLP